MCCGMWERQYKNSSNLIQKSVFGKKTQGVLQHIFVEKSYYIINNDYLNNICKMVTAGRHLPIVCTVKSNIERALAIKFREHIINIIVISVD